MIESEDRTPCRPHLGAQGRLASSLGVLLLLALAGGCHGPRLDRAPEASAADGAVQSPGRHADPAVFGNDRGRDVAAPVAVIRGKAVSKAELADFWFTRYPEEYGRTVDALLDERIVLADARRIGVRVPAKELHKAVEAEVQARRKQLQTVYGDTVTLEEEVRRAYGKDVRDWRTKILAPRLHVRLLLQRVVRWDTHSRERLLARVIVLHDEARARRIADKIRRGADFSLTALKESKDPSSRRGGTLPMMGRGDLAFPGVEERLFRAQKGSLVGPLEVSVDGKPQWQIYRVVERRPPWQGGYEQNWQRLEKDLAERPVAGPEYERWRARTRRSGAVRYFSPDGRVWEPPARR